MGMARKIEIIETTLTIRGNGKDSPVRCITQYWDLDGTLLAEVDPLRSMLHEVNDALREQAAGHGAVPFNATATLATRKGD